MMKLSKLFKKFCRKKKQLKPGEILDQVISQSTTSECLLYKLADYKRGGDLIEAIQTSGSLAVEQLIREQFGVFLYNNGKGQMINRAEYLRWKYRDNNKVIIPIEKSLSAHDPLGKWIDHKACWQMQYRGSLGETLLHILIICDTKMHTKLARILLKSFPCMAIDIIEGEEYLGASALHLAIAYSNNELVADLIAAGANVNQRAIGSFFLPRDQQREHPAKHTDYEGLAYMGEYPLAWAACCAEETVYNLLIDAGADPDAKDSFGNMILHMVVVCDKLDMFGYALRHPITSAKNGILNNQGLTPLTLACKLGRAEVFREMLELSSREFWRYSNITCSGYPLAALDTLLPDGRTNWNSALFIILNGTKEEHLDMLDGGIIQRLLEEKWKTFAQKQFLKRLLILFVHLFFLSCSVYLRPENNETANAERSEKNNDEWEIQQLMRYACEITTLAGVISFVVIQQGEEIKNQGFQAFLKQLRNAPAKAIFLVSNLLIISCIPFRIMGDIETEESILILAVPGSWFLLMFFAGAIRLTGPFVTMIYSMLTGDMFTFGIIYSILLVGFSQAFYFLFKGHPEREKSLFNNYASTWMALFHTTLGDYNYPELNQTSYPNLAKTVFVCFVIFVPILLLNMLIAMMGNTYALVIERSEKEWMKQWAKIVVTLERAVPQSDAQKYLEAYSIPLGTTEDGQEQRGVMVIKSKSKTRAKQRKGALNNWKRVGRVTLAALKKRNITGEEMRRQMWGTESNTSPAKASGRTNRDPKVVFHETNSAMYAVADSFLFTHDILIEPDAPKDLLLLEQEKKKKKKGKQIKKINLQATRTTYNVDPNTGELKKTTEIVGDPLRDLVLMSEREAAQDSNLAKSLAHRASLVGSEDVTLQITIPVIEPAQPSSPTTLVPPQSPVYVSQPAPPQILPPPVITTTPATLPATTTTVTSQAANLPENQMTDNLHAIFTEATLDPEKEREFYRKLEALEDTDDSDVLIERPVLGRISVIKRAKSAITKSSRERSIPADNLSGSFNFAWDSQNRTNLRPTHDSIIQIDDEPKPKYILNDDNDITTVEEVKQKMAEFHLRRRPDLEREYKTKRSKGPRYKNKVSPENTVDEGRRYKSEPHSYSSEDVPNPLEPWSTRNLQNINQILKQK